MERIRSKTKEFGSEGLSSGRLALDHFLARLDLALAIRSFHFGGRCNIKERVVQKVDFSTFGFPLFIH